MSDGSKRVVRGGDRLEPWYGIQGSLLGVHLRGRVNTTGHDV